MADPGSLQDYLNSRYPAAQPTQPGMVAPQPTGTGNLVTSALASGVLGAGSQIASGVEGGARLLGASSVADAAAAEAQRARASAATYANPTYENASMLDPRGLAYRVLQGLPGAVPAIAGMVAAGPVGAAVGAFPGAFGGNVQTHEDYTGKPISAGQAAKAAMLGIPEAAVAGLPLGKAEALFGGEGTIAGVAAAQAAVSAGQTALGGMMGDPDRKLADRAHDMISSALTGGATGALFGAGAHALAKAPVKDVTNDQMTRAVDTDLGREQPGPSTENATQGELPLPQPVNAERPYQNVPQATLDRLQTHFGQFETPDLFQAQAAKEIAAEQAARQETRPVAGVRGPDVVPPPPEGVPQPSPDMVDLANAHAADRPVVTPGITPDEMDTLPNFAEAREQPPAAPPGPAPDPRQAFTPSDLSQQGRGEPPDTREVSTPSQRRAEWEAAQRAQDEQAVADQRVKDYWEGAGHPAETPEPNRPPQDAVPEQHQGRWQQLEDLRPQVSDPATAKAIDDAQTKLVALKSGGNKQIDATISKLQKVADGEKANSDLAGASAPAEPQVAPKPVKADQFSETKQAVITAQKSLNAMKKMDAAPADAEPKSKTITNNLWQQGIADQQAKLTQVANELKKTGNPENLVGLPGDHFANDDFWTNNDKFNQRAQLALDQHAEHEENVLGALREAPMMRARVPSPLDPAPPPGDPVNAGLHTIISNGGDASDALAHIASNGSNAFSKVVARLLLKAGVNSDLRYSSPNAGATSYLHAGEVPVARYDAASDRIHIHSNVGMEQSILHEGVHAATTNALNANTPAARELASMYQDVKLRSPGNDAYGLRNVHEFVAEAFSNPTFQAHLDSLSSEPTVNNGRLASMWQKFKDVVGKVLGARGSQKTMLDEVLDAGQRLMDENPTARPVRTPQDTDAALQPMMARIADAGEKLKDMAEETVTNAAPKARAAWMGFRDSLGIARWYSKFAPSMDAHVTELDRRDLLNETNNKAARAAIQKPSALPEESQKKLQALAKATFMGIDGRQDWGAHRHLFDKANVAELGKEHAKVNGIWRRMSDTEKDAYNTAIAANRAHVQQIVTTSLNNILKGDYAGKVPLPEGWDPNEDYRFKPELHDDPVKNEQYWASTYKDLAQLAQNHIDAVDGQKAKLTGPGVESRAAALDKSVAPLRSLISDHATRMDELDRVPNFPMGREGGHFVAGKLALGEDGQASEKNVNKLQDMLNKTGFGHLTIDRNLENPSIYARVDAPSQRASLRKVFDQAHAEGILEDGSVSDGPIGQIASGVTPQWQERAMEIMRASMRGLGDGADDATKDLLEQRASEMQREFLNALPPSSLNRIMARREGVQGFSEDMMNNVRQRMTATSRAIANIASQPRIAETVVGMRKDLETLNRSQATTTQKDAVHQAVQELVRREGARTAAQPGAPMQALRELTHVMEVGASPAYTFMLLGQNFTLGLPRLGAAMGFLKSASAMGRQTKTAFDVMRAVAGGSEGLKFGMREADLQKAGLGPKMIDFLMHQDAMGTFAHSAMTSAMRSEHGDPTSAFGKTRSAASALGLYSEMQPRVLMALAAKDLFEKKGGSNRSGEDLHSFVHRMVEDSQLNWNPTFNARQTTKAGSFGSFSPLINQFMGYSTRMTEMLIRETANSFGHGTAEEQAEGRKFLMAHLAVMTTLAGSLGSPMVAVLASVYDRLADWATGKDDNDITASYRRYLANTFGKETGEVLARGVPRAFGLDLSHWGDERIAPGSTAVLMLTEKRKLEDAEKDWLKAEAGSAAGLVANVGFAARDIANGDYLRGLQKMVPELFRGPVEAVQLAQYGYRDKSGMKLPITATAKDIMLTAMGLDPQQEAEYNEMKKTVAGETNLAQLRSGNITQHLSQALSRGDQQNFAYWVDQSRQFQMDHPGQTPPISDLSRYMQQHIKNAAFAHATGLPVNPRNLTARGMVSYGDLNRQ